MKKWYKKTIFSSLTILASISIAAPLVILNTNKEQSNLIFDSQNNSLNEINNNEKASNGKDLTPSVSNFINGKLVSKSGPIVFWGDTIMSLDWFGSVRWKITLTGENENFIQKVGNQDLHIFPSLGNTNDKNTTTQYASDIKRSWVNWDLDKNNDILWILSNVRWPKNNDWSGNGGFSNQDWKRQWVIGINVKDGSFYARAKTARIQGRNDVYRNLSILSNGDPTPYGISFPINNKYGGSGKSYNFQFERFKVKENINNNSSMMEEINSRSTAELFKERNQENADATDFMFNIIPLGTNVNLVLTVEKSSMRNTGSGDTSGPWVDNNDNNISSNNFGDVNQRTMNVYGTLVDDELNIINNTSPWDKPNIIIENKDTRIRNKWVTPQRDWYKLLDGRIVTIIYDYLIIINPTENNHNPKINTKKLDDINNQWVESWSFDTDESLYVKGHGATKIRKVILDKNKNGTNHIISDYINLSNLSNEEVQKAALSTSIYNVPGYSGQVMGIKTYTHLKFSDDLPNIVNNENNEKYGLSLAIIKNKETDNGDLRGLLNTDQAFQKSVDFEIKKESLDKKLPSEISREDINVLNEGFLTENKDKDENNGELLYPPLVKDEVIDKDGVRKLQITVHLDQIPWFVSNGKMPSDIKPTKMTKTYDNEFVTKLSSRFSWKSIENDYDFKNTIPTKVEISYINKLDPLISNLQSQRAIIGDTSYPKVSYSIASTDDTNGKITIKADYTYLPMDVKIVNSNLKTFTTTKEYDIFKSTDQKKFQFVGNNNTDISNIPELKELKESEILPSYFNTITDKQEFLKFIDIDKTKGYPLEKVKISTFGDDEKGTLKITVNTNSNFDNSKNGIFEKTFTGLNKNNVYTLKFKEPNLQNYNKISYLPSKVSEEDIYSHFVTYSGFNAKDFQLILNPNDVIGELGVSIILNNNFPESSIKDGTDFTKQSDGSYLAFKKFNGFKTNDLLNKEYQIIFKDLSNLNIKDDKKLIELMKFTPSYIQTQLAKGSGITIEGENFNSVKSLSKLFIKSYGSKIPANFETDNNVTADMFINNSAGEITLKITFDKLENYPNSISFVQSFGGFSKGNDIATDDVLSFYDENLFFTMNSSYKALKPSQVVQQLTSNKKLIKDFFSTDPTGAYKIAIDQEQFTLSMVADDSNGKLILTIKFEKSIITNNQSLLEYTLEYNGFDHY